MSTKISCKWLQKFQEDGMLSLGYHQPLRGVSRVLRARRGAGGIPSITPLCQPTCPIWLDNRGTGQWKWMEEVPRRTSLAPLASPCFLLCLTGQERKISPKRNFWAGHLWGHPAKNFGQALQILEKQAFWHGRPAQTSMKKLWSEKLLADFLFPNSGKN